jgi:hypothetical protein
MQTRRGTPVLAEFYIVQDTTTKRCTIAEQRPTTRGTGGRQAAGGLEPRDASLPHIRLQPFVALCVVGMVWGQEI